MADRKEEKYAMELLRRHINELSECSRNFAKLKCKLYSFGVITKEDYEEMDVPGKSSYQRFADLYTKIPRGRTNWLNALVIVWIGSENDAAIKVLLGQTVGGLEEKGINAFTDPSHFSIKLTCKGNVLSVQSIELDKGSNDRRTTSDGVWFGMSDLVHNFSGRASELEKLHVLVTENRSSNESTYALITSIHGLGGIGKTSLARKYAWVYGEYFDNNVIWVPSETKDLMTAAFRDLAKRLDINNYDHLRASEKVRSVYLWFGDKKSLFIFDSVEDIDGINGVKQFFPVGIRKRPYILITSRRNDLVQNHRVLPLDVLSDEDAIELLQNQDCLPNATFDMYVKLYETLGNLPLALQQAISYINSTLGLYEDMDQAIRAYLREYEKQHFKLMYGRFVSSDGYQDTVWTTWNITLKMIKTNEKLGDFAEYVLQILAYMYPDQIYIEYILALIEKFKFPYNLMQCSSRIEINAAIQLLSKYSMITFRTGVINIHRLLQQVVRQKCKEEKEIVNQVVKLLYHDYLRDFPVQNALNMITILPYFDKYKLESSYKGFRAQCHLPDFINNQIVGTSRNDALDLIRFTGNCMVEFAVKFIKAMETSNAFELYIKTCECLRNYFPKTIVSNTFILCWSMFILILKHSSMGNVQVKYVTKLLLQLSMYMDRKHVPICYLKSAVKMLGGDIKLFDDVLKMLVKYNVYHADEENDLMNSKMVWNYTSTPLGSLENIIVDWFYSSEYLNIDIDIHDIGKLTECLIESYKLNSGRPEGKTLDNTFNQVMCFRKELRMMLSREYWCSEFNEVKIMILCFISEAKFLQYPTVNNSNQYLQLYSNLMHFRETVEPNSSYVPLLDLNYYDLVFSNKLKVRLEALDQLSSSIHENHTSDELNSIILPLQDMTRELHEINKGTAKFNIF